MLCSILNEFWCTLFEIGFAKQSVPIDFRNIHWEVNFATFSLSDSQNKGYVCITGNVRGYAHIVIGMLRWERVVMCVVSVCQIVDQ